MLSTITHNKYDEMVKHHTPESKTPSNILKAFVCGGGICIIGELIKDLIGTTGLQKEVVDSFTTIIMIGLGAALTALNIYQIIGKFAGAGSIVPITGFANSIVSPAMEFKSEGLVTGTGAKMFIIAGPVLVYGISAAIVVGLIKLLILSLFY